MILECNKRLHRFGGFEYEVKSNGDKIGCAQLLPSTVGETWLRVVVDNEEIDFMAYNMFGVLVKRKDNEVGKFRSNKNESIIHYCTKKGSNVFNGIFFWETEYLGRKYEIYEVGHGRKGIYYCIWSQGITVAIISKVMFTKNFESGYIIYSENNVPQELLVGLNIFIDLTRYFQTREGGAGEWHALNTWQKELKEKYDSSFIPRIMAEEDGKK